MRKHIFSVLLCLSMMLILLPMTAFAEVGTVTVLGVVLENGHYYTVDTDNDPNYALVDETTEQPSEGTPYLYYDGGELTVYGDVILKSGGPCPLVVGAGTLNISGSGSLELSCSGAPTVGMVSDSYLTLSGSLDFTAEQTGGAPAISGGILQTADGYSGDFTINASGSSALLDLNAINLQTTGDISISGSGASVIGRSPGNGSSDNVTLKGRTVLLTSSSSGVLISETSTISITATDGGLNFSGNIGQPLLNATSTTLSADGNITIENSGYIAVFGDLTITDAQDVSILSATGQAVIGIADITATGDVTITSQNNSFAVLDLKVRDAGNVTVTSNASSPTIINSVDINVSGDVKIENTGTFGAIPGGSNVSIITTDGSISVSGKGAMPVISASGDITLNAKGNILVQRKDDLAYPGGLITAAGSTSVTSESGLVIFSSDDLGTTIAIGDGDPIYALYGGDVSGGLNLAESTPIDNTYYKAGDGYVIWETSGKITLYNATISNVNEPVSHVVGMAHQGIALLDGDFTIMVEGTNNISSTNSHAIGYNNTNVTLEGDGILTVDGQGSDIELAGSLGFAVGSNVTLNGIVYLNNANPSTTVYGDVTLHNDSCYDDTIIETGAKLTIPEGEILYLDDTTSITNNGQIINNGEIILPYDYTVSDIEALNITGSGKIRLYNMATDEYKVYIGGAIYVYGGSSDVDLSTVPTEATYFKAGSGYITYTPDDATLTLHNVDSSPNITLPNIPITMLLEGENEAYQIIVRNSVTVDGNGTLDATYIDSTAEGAELTVNSGTALNALCETISDGVTTFNVYGSYLSDNIYYLDGNYKMALKPGAVYTMILGSGIEFYENSTLNDITFGEGSEIVNNGYMILPLGTTAEQIAALPLSGTGVVYVTTAYNGTGAPEVLSDPYTNDGIALNNVVLGDLTLDYTEVTAADNLGYTWLKTGEGADEVWTLTLDNTYIDGSLNLPDGTVIINTVSDSNIWGSIRASADYPCDLTFTGSGSLNAGLDVYNGQGGEVTIDEGTDVTLAYGLNVGESGGVNGVLNVNGTLTASSPVGVVINTGSIKIGSKGVLNVSGEVGIKLNGMNSEEGTVYDDAFVIIDGGTLNADCTDANIEVFTNFNEATENAADEVIVLPDGYMPSGYLIRIVSGENGGTQYAYTIAATNAVLTLESELVDGAGGKLTLKKTSNNNDDDNHSSSGSGDVLYVLTFDTNGGSNISKVYKAYGSVIKLNDYVPTYDGFEFDGWYTDEKLTDNVTSVKLTGNTTIYAKWTGKASNSTDTKDNTNPFIDVANTDYYHDAVLWAVEKGITNGTTDTTFSPDMICTRAQMVTLLWKAMGSPEPDSSFCSFTDVANNAYYYKAVLWAVENGIAAGTSATTFGPNDTVTRAQALTFMWRAQGKPVVNCINRFTDVTGDDYYYNAIIWAVEKNITQGSSTTTFSPSDFCTRAQIVTFLYRAQL